MQNRQLQMRARLVRTSRCDVPARIREGGMDWNGHGNFTRDAQIHASRNILTLSLRRVAAWTSRCDVHPLVGMARCAVRAARAAQREGKMARSAWIATWR